ncbi:MAG: hypothetical protein GX312_04875 [Candidatus Phytoplasma sp.]|nr:hypothetical protein [Phytoplasma sp.]
MTYAMTLDNSWELMSEDEMYEVNGGMTVSELALIIDVGLITASFVIGAVSIAQSSWTAAKISRGLIRNVLTKVALSSLKSMISPFLSFIGIAAKYTTLILGTATALGGALFNWTIGGFIANVLDFNNDGIVFN